MTSAPLWHYTCEHGRDAIGDVGLVRTLLDWNPDVAAGVGVGTWGQPLVRFSWFTDLSEPVAAALGLTRHTIACDRTAHRYRVLDAVDIAPWVEYRRTVDPRLVDRLELAPGAMPRHWWISTSAVPVVRDERT